MATFGNTALDGTNTSTIENVIVAGLYTPGQPGTPVTMTAQITKSTTDHHNFKFAIYDSTDMSIVALSDEIGSGSSGTETVTASFTTVVTDLIAARPYYLAAWGQAGTGTLTINNTTSAGTSYSNFLTYDPIWPEPGVVEFPSTMKIDIYCTYTSSIAPGTDAGNSMPPYVL